jgi:hypothetical protein
MLVGNLLALVRPPSKQQDDAELNKAPVGRTIAMAVMGGIAALWALVSLISG